VNASPPAHSLHPASAGGIFPDGKVSAEIGKNSTVEMDSAAVSQHSPHAMAHPIHDDLVAMRKQEDEDRRLAMALQQEENVKAFEDRNRRFGSDRRSSRSTAYCAPGYRPRLLDDGVDVSSAMMAGSPGRKKRPPMSASHYFAPPSTLTGESTTHEGLAHTRTYTDTNMEDQYEMDLKPPAVNMNKQKENRGKSNGDINDGLDQHDIDQQHNHDFSISSLSSRRLQYKDDSDLMSLFGEGGNIIPSSNANSTGSITRVRNMFMGVNSNKNNNGNQNSHSIDLDQAERKRRNEQRSPRREASRRDHNNDHHQQQNNQDSSLLSQVAHHILGNFGVGGSWTDNDASHSNRNPSDKPDHLHSPHGESMEAEVEMELGQEVIMDVRDESSSMPPPLTRGAGTQVDWASRAGCHSWIPDAIGYSEAPSSHFGRHEKNRDQRGKNRSAHHGNDHSLTGQTSYSRADISPINSMDMDFSRSSIHGSSHRHNGRGAQNTLMNVFDQKNDDSHPGDLLPQIHRSALQQLPSWERSYRSRSEVSLGDMSCVNGMDDSLIRVNSNTVKDNLFKKKVIPSMTSSGQDGPESRPEDGNHHVHHDMDMDWD
jgi:hypothetical protein